LQISELNKINDKVVQREDGRPLKKQMYIYIYMMMRMMMMVMMMKSIYIYKKSYKEDE